MSSVSQPGSCRRSPDRAQARIHALPAFSMRCFDALSSMPHEWANGGLPASVEPRAFPGIVAHPPAPAWSEGRRSGGTRAAWRSGAGPASGVDEKAHRSDRAGLCGREHHEDSAAHRAADCASVHGQRFIPTAAPGDRSGGPRMERARIHPDRAGAAPCNRHRHRRIITLAG